jgi:hypothetical protein
VYRRSFERVKVPEIFTQPLSVFQLTDPKPLGPSPPAAQNAPERTGCYEPFAANGLRLFSQLGNLRFELLLALLVLDLPAHALAFLLALRSCHFLVPS